MTLETLAPSSGRGSSSQGRLVLSWLLVVLLLGYGVVQTLTTAAKLFGRQRRRTAGAVRIIHVAA